MNTTGEDKRVYRLLYIEDDFYSRDSFQRLYSNYYDVDVAANAEEAIELAKKNDYDAFIVDINLGRSIDGTQVVRILKEMEGNQEKPFIALTSYVGQQYRDEFLSKGLTHFFGKPVLLEDFIYNLTKIVGPPKKDTPWKSRMSFYRTGG